jgi:hypothetical protein
MTLAISGTVPAQPYTPSPSPAPVATTQPAPQPQAPSDTVTLSESAQVSQLSLQGQSPSLIAESLGLPVSTVDLDLGIVAPNLVSKPAAAPPAAPRAEAAPAAAAASIPAAPLGSTQKTPSA